MIKAAFHNTADVFVKIEWSVQKDTNIFNYTVQIYKQGTKHIA